MSKSIRQFRFYGMPIKDSNGNITNEHTKANYPENLDWERLHNGNIFSDYSAITKLGIQGRPGASFWLNDGQYPIYIGETGIYEIDLEGYGQIFKIQFDSATLDWYNGDGKGDRLLIDIVFEGSGESA